MRDVNNIHVIGRLGRDPEAKQTQTGKTVCNFAIATTDGEETQWFNVQAWDKLAEIVMRYVRKGSRVYVAGRMRSRTYQDQSGAQKEFWYINADTVQMLDSKQQQEQPQQQTVQSLATQQAPQSETDDLPF